MRNILLVEPDYRSKFPPLGLLRLASYHKSCGDKVTFIRGCNATLRAVSWHRVYVSSLFTYELPRTVKTIRYYRDCVDSDEDIVVGGIGATLLPGYIREHAPCRIITGPLSSPRIIDGEPRPIAKYLPDYSIIDSSEYAYSPKDAYYCRITMGCIRNCSFCAVPALEPRFGYYQPLKTQIQGVITAYGERQHLVLLDNNILAVKNLDQILDQIGAIGFESGALRSGKKRTVDFNQGIDARLITRQIANQLGSLSLSPVRLAFDFRGMEKAYRKAIGYLAGVGFQAFTNYVMFNFHDDPRDFYERLRINLELSNDLGIRITGFPMKYSPITDVHRHHVADKWKWRYLRGIQCVLLATHGMVSPSTEFFNTAFGESFDQFIEILSMPDRYIIYRNHYENNGAQADWRKLFKRLSLSKRDEFLDLLSGLNRNRKREETISSIKDKQFRPLLEHYYPEGKRASQNPCKNTNQKEILQHSCL